MGKIKHPKRVRLSTTDPLPISPGRCCLSCPLQQYCALCNVHPPTRFDLPTSPHTHVVRNYHQRCRIPCAFHRSFSFPLLRHRNTMRVAVYCCCSWGIYYLSISNHNKSLLSLVQIVSTSAKCRHPTRPFRRILV